MKDDDVTTTQDKNNSDSNEKIDMEQMKSLIPVRPDEQGRQVVDGRQLYDALELKGGFCDWIQNQLKRMEAKEGVDYVKFYAGESGGGSLYFYQITLDIAKRLATIAGATCDATSRTLKISNAMQLYFLECEKIALSKRSEPTAVNNPSYIIENPAERARAWADEYEERMKAIEERNKLIHHGKLYTTTEIAKELNLRSPQQLNKYLEHKKVQYEINGTWVLYSEYSESNYVSTKQQIDSDTGKISYSRKWTGEGRDFILSLWKCEQMKTKRLFEIEYSNSNKSTLNSNKIYNYDNHNQFKMNSNKTYKEFMEEKINSITIIEKAVVGVHTKTGEVVKYSSVSEAAREYGTRPQNITACLKGRSKSAKGYKWYYAKNYEGEVK